MKQSSDDLHLEDGNEEAAHRVRPLHNPLPQPVRVKRSRMEFRPEASGDEFDIDAVDGDDFDI